MTNDSNHKNHNFNLNENNDKQFVYVVSAFDFENDLVATFVASSYNNAEEMAENVMQMDDNIYCCGFSGTYMNEVMSNVTVH